MQKSAKPALSSLSSPSSGTVRFASDAAKTVRFVGGAQVDAAKERAGNIRAYSALAQAQRNLAVQAAVKAAGGKSAADSTRPAGELRAEAKKYRMKVGTGGSFNRTSRGGFDRQLRKMALTNRMTFRNFSSADKKRLGDLLERHATARTTGGVYSWSDRRRMKEEIDGWYRKDHVISRADMVDMKKIVEAME